jgi:hypothetical protein
MAEFDDQQPQVPNWHAVALVVGLQTDHAGVARRVAQPAQLTLDPALQHWIETRVGLFGSTARNEATASSDVDVWLKLELEALLERPACLAVPADQPRPLQRPAFHQPCGR